MKQGKIMITSKLIVRVKKMKSTFFSYYSKNKKKTCKITIKAVESALNRSPGWKIPTCTISILNRKSGDGILRKHCLPFTNT